ncbi:hypothetical protein [Methanocella sp. MCL-LM]|uniref:hypothetical protein n=1 Tax=Methanocella sp. MCL-LM TaxID=3412035 RepID=UPI003C73A06B
MVGRYEDDNDGQWILLIAVIISIGMAVLLVFVNQSVLAGHSSATSIMDFPKNDIRDLRSETVSETYILGTRANEAPDFDKRKQWFDSNFTRFAKDESRLMEYRGAVLNVSYLNMGYNASAHPNIRQIENITLNIYYNNGNTMYNETTIVYL